MPNIALLLDNIAQMVKSDKSNQTLFSTLDLRYAYSQNPSDKITRKQCGLTDMPAQFQKAIDLTLTNCSNTYAYLDDILIVTNGTIETHHQKLQTVLTKLDEKILAVSLDKSKFACKQVECLGFNINSEGTEPLLKKTESIQKLSPQNFRATKKLHVFNTSPNKVYTESSKNSGRPTAHIKKH